MLVLGINNNDLASACLVNEKKILASAYEERFTRIKMHKTWPAQSIDYVLKSNNLTLNDIDYIAYGWAAGFNADKHLLMYFDRISEAALNEPETLPFIRKRINDEIHNDIEKKQEFCDFIRENQLEKKVFYIDHHECHALGAYACSPFNKALVVTCDGRGDFQSLTISLYKNRICDVLHRETSIDSVGYFYGRITKLLGYTPNKHEGKITGLAAYGQSEKCLSLMKEMIDIKNGFIRAKCGMYYQPSYHGYTDEIINRIKNESPEDIAAAAQIHLEMVLVELISHYVRLNNIKHICLAGGVFGNVKLNQKIQEIAGIENIYVLPCMEDGGLSLASAVATVFLKTGARIKAPTMDLGPEYSEHDFLKSDSQFSNIYMKKSPQTIFSTLAKAIEANKVIGVFRGRMEFGPRALCKRSILYHARDLSCNQWLNQRMKRTEFMPFAPVVAENLAERCFLGWKRNHVAARFMTVTYQCTAEMKFLCPAVVHVDGSARPQIIRKEDDLFMYEFLNYWHQQTGQLCLINTSFNKHEEPIVCSPEDALKSLEEKIIDILFVNESLFISQDDSLIKTIPWSAQKINEDVKTTSKVA